MRYIYSFLLYLIAPFILIYLKKRAKKNKQYNLFWNERFGFKLENKIAKPIIWLHAVSVGETRAMAKLVKIFTEQYPSYQLLITQMTPTGRETAKLLYPNVELHYVPYDLPHAVINFYKTFKPKIGLIMETEIWPNLIFYADKFKIPLFLINARLSDKSFNSYNKIKYILSPILNKFSGILCQNQATYDNFVKLCQVANTQVIGNTKFDIIIDQNQFKIAKYFKSNLQEKKVVIFASTRIGEEKLILDSLPEKFSYLLIIVPRHLERFTEVESLLIKKQLMYQKRSDNKPIDTNTQVFIGNSMGEMIAYYTMADIAVIGGSFNDNGGQNLIEPIYLHKPVIFGQSMYNFAEVAKNALADNCALQVANPQECFVTIEKLLNNEELYNQLVENCSHFTNRYQGASEQIVSEVAKYLS